MGDTISKLYNNKTVEIIVKTGDVKGAGTNSNVYIVLIDDNDNRSKDIQLDCKWRDDFEKGNEDSFTVDNIGDLRRVQMIELWRDDSGLLHSWFVEFVKVKQVVNGKQEVLPFPLHRWIQPNRKYKFTLYDSVLPQYDLNGDQRRQEMEERKEAYVFQGDGSSPRRITECPPEKMFSNDYQWDLTSLKVKLMAGKVITGIMTGGWDNLDDIVKVYRCSFGIPYGYYNWKADKEFGRQRLTGCASNLIELCKEIPSNFAVTEEMLKPFLDGKSLIKALAEKEIYIVNLKVMEGIVCKDNRLICPAMALFHAKENGELMPLAIQLFQQPADNNPVFLPSDPEYTWMLAKMFYNNAEVSLHQACVHLGFTHLVCESICVAVHRCLSPSHPVFRLLAPHFLYLIAINCLAIEKLLAPGEWIDVTMTPGASGVMEILKKIWKDWRLDVNGWLPADLKQRGVDDFTKLPGYLYRNDALKLHQAIWDYVSEVVNNIYDTSEKLEEDNEIQELAANLVDSKDGAGLKGVFGNGKFKSTDDLIKILTSAIFMASVQHAAANFCQYDEYAFPPNYPANLNGEPPRDKTPLSEEDIIRSIPDKDTTLSIMVVTKLLSQRGTQPLGDFEIPYQYHPMALAAIKKFQGNLNRISNEIFRRNKDLEIPYPYLDPKEIPNAISI